MPCIGRGPGCAMTGPSAPQQTACLLEGLPVLHNPRHLDCKGRTTTGLALDYDVAADHLTERVLIRESLARLRGYAWSPPLSCPAPSRNRHADANAAGCFARLSDAGERVSLTARPECARRPRHREPADSAPSDHRFRFAGRGFAVRGRRPQTEQNKRPRPGHAAPSPGRPGH